MLTLRSIEEAENHIGGFFGVQICPTSRLWCFDGYPFGAAVEC